MGIYRYLCLAVFESYVLYLCMKKRFRVGRKKGKKEGGGILQAYSIVYF